MYGKGIKVDHGGGIIYTGWSGMASGENILMET